MPGQGGKRPGQSLGSLLFLGIKLPACAPTASRASFYPLRPHTGWDCLFPHSSLSLDLGQHLDAQRARQMTRGKGGSGVRYQEVGGKCWG